MATDKPCGGCNWSTCPHCTVDPRWAAIKPREYGRIDPDDPITSSDVKRAGIKPSPAPLTPGQVEAAYAAKAAARATRLARVHQQPRGIDNAFERPDVRSGGIRSVWD